MKRNIKLTIEYDGTNYHGWQSQAGSGNPTIQDALEQALKTLTKTDCKTCSSGRTDAGVHAFGHVANFKTASSIPAEACAPALNHLLAVDIRVLASEQAPEDQNATACLTALRQVAQSWPRWDRSGPCSCSSDSPSTYSP